MSLDALMKLAADLERAAFIQEGEDVPLTRVLERRHDGDWPVTLEWLLLGFRHDAAGRLWVGAAEFNEWHYGGELFIDHGPSCFARKEVHPTCQPGGCERRTLRTRNEVRLFCAAFKIPMPESMRPLWTPPPPSE